MLKPDQDIVKKGGLNYIVDTSCRPLHFKPWLGDAFSFLYDLLMKKTVFPKKLNADIIDHINFMNETLKDIHDKKVLELAAGSGCATQFLANDNEYTGTDISPGLLKIAVKKFRKSGFLNPEFYICSAEELPFENESFDVCLCMLALNFFDPLDQAVREISRILKKGAVFLCAVPVPERNEKNSTIRGKLYSEDELKQFFESNHFKFEVLPFQNGALLYFKGIKN